ncbi:MAG: FtsQ-type POTRA domain-containing protein [Calditrichaceae bacterium]
MLNRRKKKKLRAGFIYLFIIAGLSAAAYGYKWIDAYLQESLTTFKLENIEINGNKILSRQDVLSLCGLEEDGSQLLTIKPSEVVDKICRSPYVKAANAVRSLPSKLRITILEREPVAFIYGRGLNLIDEEGVLIPVPRNSIRWNLPFISGVKASLGALGHKTVAERALLGVEIIDYMRMIPSSLNEMISEIDLSRDDYVILRLIHGGAEVRIDRSNYQENLFILNQYFEKYLQWNQLPGFDYVDVRFKDQLIIKNKNG